MWQQDPDTRPSSAAHARVLRRDFEIMKVHLEAFRMDAEGKAPRWGTIDDDKIVAWREFLIRSGAVRERRDRAAFYTSEFVDRFNSFDAGRVVAQARVFQG